MSDTKNILTKTELQELLGGWRRHLNPFHNPKSAIDAATKHDLVLRKKAFWSIRQRGIDSTNMGLLTSASIISISLIILGLYLHNIIIHIASLIPLWGLGFMCITQEKQITNAIERPLFLSDSRSTGYPELDIILSSGPFEAEAILAEGGLQADEIKKLAGFIEIVKEKNEIDGQFAEGVVTVKTTVDTSSKTWGLVKRATEIMSGKSVPQYLASASPVIDIFSVMEYAGIGVHTKPEKPEFCS